MTVEFRLPLDRFSPDGFKNLLGRSFPDRLESEVKGMLDIPVSIRGNVEAFYVQYEVVNKDNGEKTAEFRIDIDEFTGFDTVHDLYLFWRIKFFSCWNFASGTKDDPCYVVAGDKNS